MVTTTARFLDKVEMVADGCWEWRAGRTRTGYGQFRVSTTIKTYAHRFAHELWIGPIPDGMEIDHLCRNRGCVNPTHLEVVEHTENMRRSAGFARGPYNVGDTCSAGHPRSPENTGTNGRGTRFCRPCHRDAVRRCRLSRR